MKQFYINNNSDKLIIFFTGWGCDENEFSQMEADCDVLIFYDYLDLDYQFDFFKYSEIDILAFSAGVFIGAVFEHNFKINKKIAVSGNPYLLDENLGLSDEMLDYLYNLIEEKCEFFARNYLVMTDEEFNLFHPSHRTIESCRAELDALEVLYRQKYDKIKDSYDYAIFGEYDPIFNVENQKKYYGSRIKIVPDARHNLFFRFKSYKEFFDFV